MKQLLWTPSEAQQRSSRMYDYLQYINRRFHLDFTGYDALYDWSVAHADDFWMSLWDYFDILAPARPTAAATAPETFIETGWFPGAKLNYTENMLRWCDRDGDAIIFYGEDHVRTTLSWRALQDKTLRFANALRQSGIAAGDVVAAYMPNLPETIIAMLATAAIGAVWCSCATDIGPGAAIDRLGQTAPKLLITADGYYYKGKTFPVLPNASQIAAGIPSVREIVVVHYAGDMGLAPYQTMVAWDAFSARAKGADFTYDHYSYDHPMVVMFSSGTTGKPKCMVQSGMGLLLNQLKELALHTDLGASDRLLYITSCSWMMWNWQAAALGCGTTLVLYDGNPSYPDTAAIWRILERERVSVFGLSASYIHALIKEGFHPGKTVDLTALREISQTGSALSEEGFRYVYSEIKQDYFFNSIAGGTDINGCFAIGSFLKPIYSGELQSVGLGMCVKCYDDDGRAVRDTQGELICERPVPPMPLYFWNDPGNEKYHNAYFADFPGRWRHGDYIIHHADTGGVTFCGRSDSILKPSGVRIGTAEIYNQVETLSEVSESLAIGQDYHGDQRIILFVCLRAGLTLDAALEKKIRTTLRVNASPRHVPAVILQVAEIPHTLNGKKVESAVTNLLNGRSVTNRDALSNPAVLSVYEKLAAQLQ